jgi:hypothetical protein
VGLRGSCADMAEGSDPERDDDLLLE